MTKITIVNCIITAVCVFQTAEAGFLPNPKSIVNSLLDNVPKVPNPLENPLGNIKDLENKLKNGLQIPQKGLQISGLQIPGFRISELPIPEYVNALYNETINAGKELTSNFTYCVLNKTKSVSGEVQELRNAVNKLRENLSKVLQKYNICLQDVFTAIMCITQIRDSEVSQILNDIFLDFGKVIHTAYKLIGFFLEIGKCYQEAMNR